MFTFSSVEPASGAHGGAVFSFCVFMALLDQRLTLS